MRFFSGVVSLLLMGTIFSSASFAQSSYRLNRNAAAQSDGNTVDSSIASPGQYSQPLYDQPDSNAVSPSRTRPLTGGVEHRASMVDPSEYQNPMYGRTDGNQLQGGNQTMQMRSGVASNPPLAAGSMNNGPFFAGLNQLGNPLQGLFPNFGNLPPLSTDVSRTKLPGDISDLELKQLQSRDIVIMQDRSSSMGEHENFPQGNFPRWYWCLSQALDFRRQTMRMPNWEFTLVLFSSKYDVYRNVRMEQLPSIFDRNHIWIGTKLAQPMAEQLNDYFRRRAQGRARPLLIVVVTDGKPKDEGDLAEVIIDATQHLQNPREVHITFLQVGTDDESQRKLWMLDNELVHRGAKFDIVSVMPFGQVTQLGLTRSMLRALQEGR